MLETIPFKYRLAVVVTAALALMTASGAPEAPHPSWELPESAASYEGYQILQDQIGEEQTCIIAKLIEDSSCPELIRSIIAVESEWQVNAVSPLRAIGLMQIRSSAAADINPGITEEILFNPMRNVELGIAIFEKYMDYFDDYSDPEQWALTSYNRGLFGAISLDMDPPSTSYSRRVLLNMEIPQG
ncbi:MAG: lytic transglycosylase domain-containing protein [Calditrichota bacterium]